MSNDFFTCRTCAANEVSLGLDLGSAAVCSRSSTNPQQPVPRVQFRLGSCSHCGLTQLIDSPQIELLRPEREWTLFRDPERHLGDLCEAMVEQIPSRDCLAIGLTYKDTPLLNQLKQLGITRTVELDRIQDWGLTNPRDGIETMQQCLTPQWAESIRARYGPADILSVRHMLEHAQDVSEFLTGCRHLMSPKGWILFETPGCESEFARGDVGALWEEHVMYFTPTTLRRALEHHGFQCRFVGNYPYAVEDCLAVFGQFADESAHNELNYEIQSTTLSVTDHDSAPTASRTTTGSELIMKFSSARSQLRRRLDESSRSAASSGRRVALWGAGHRTSTLVELLPAGDLIDCVIDDDPSKQGRYLPGSGIPILSSEALASRDIGFCLGLLNPGIMRRIINSLPIELTRKIQFTTFAEFAAPNDRSITNANLDRIRHES